MQITWPYRSPASKKRNIYFSIVSTLFTVSSFTVLLCYTLLTSSQALSGIAQYQPLSFFYTLLYIWADPLYSLVIHADLCSPVSLFLNNTHNPSSWIILSYNTCQFTYVFSFSPVVYPILLLSSTYYIFLSKCTLMKDNFSLSFNWVFNRTKSKLGLFLLWKPVTNKFPSFADFL